jgi:uncharacterized protein with GYD domain
MAEKQSCPGSMTTGGMQSTLDGAEVDEKGVLHCSYTCTPIKVAPSSVKTVCGFAEPLGKLGNVRTQTLPAFSAAEMQTIISKMK